MNYNRFSNDNEEPARYFYFILQEDIKKQFVKKLNDKASQIADSRSGNSKPFWVDVRNNFLDRFSNSEEAFIS